MTIVLLSGGSGKRLWPLSNSTMSKQFLEILPTKDGGKESMVQRIYRQIKSRISSRILIVAPIEQHELIRLQLGNEIEIVEEPCRRGTYNAIKLACAHLVKDKTSEFEQVCVVPVDTFVDDGFFNIVEDVKNSITNSGKMITLIGITPSYPSTKYGYIVPQDNNYNFIEKPSENKAQEYINKGGLWNAGIFGFNLRLFSRLDLDFVLYHYQNQEDISFDCKVCENTNSIALIQYNHEWKDIGTWNTLSEEISTSYGNVIQDECVNTTVINTLNKPLVALGLEDIIVATTNDGILVSKKTNSQKIKNYLKDARPFFERKRWGKYSVIDCGEGFLIKHLYINKGKEISYQSHRYRKEIWTIVSGKGIVTINDSTILVKNGDSVTIEIGDKHKIYAEEDIMMVETQLGHILEESDIERY